VNEGAGVRSVDFYQSAIWCFHVGEQDAGAEEER